MDRRTVEEDKEVYVVGTLVDVKPCGELWNNAKEWGVYTVGKQVRFESRLCRWSECNINHVSSPCVVRRRDGLLKGADTISLAYEVVVVGVTYLTAVRD